jgi:hypothetical protein
MIATGAWGREVVICSDRGPGGWTQRQLGQLGLMDRQNLASLWGPTNHMQDSQERELRRNLTVRKRHMAGELPSAGPRYIRRRVGLAKRSDCLRHTPRGSSSWLFVLKRRVSCIHVYI